MRISDKDIQVIVQVIDFMKKSENVSSELFFFSFYYTFLYEDQLKSSLADQDTLLECHQMRFIF